MKYFSQFLAKVYTLLNAEDFQWTTSFIQKLYQIHIKSESQERRDFFEFFSFVTEYSFKLLMTIYTISYILLMLYPACMYFITGRREFFIPLYIIGIDAETPIGYSITLFFHFVLFSISLAVWGGYDYLVGIIIISSPIFSKLITMDLNQMNVELNGNRFRKFNALCRFRNILLMQLEMKEYVEIHNLVELNFVEYSIHFINHMFRFMDRIDGLGYLVFSFTIGTAFCGAVLWLYVIMMVIINCIWSFFFNFQLIFNHFTWKIGFLPGYGLFVAMLLQIGMPCVLGFFVEFAVCTHWSFILIVIQWLINCVFCTASTIKFMTECWRWIGMNFDLVIREHSYCTCNLVKIQHCSPSVDCTLWIWSLAFRCNIRYIFSNEFIFSNHVILILFSDLQ